MNGPWSVIAAPAVGDRILVLRLRRQAGGRALELEIGVSFLELEQAAHPGAVLALRLTEALNLIEHARMDEGRA